MVESIIRDGVFPACEEPRPGFALSAADFEVHQDAVDEQAMVAVTSRRGIIVYVNDRFCEVSGYSRQELIGVTHKRVNSGRHSYPFWRDLWQTIGAGGVWHGQICNGKHDGSHYWTDCVIRPLRRDEGIFGYLAVSRLVSEMQQATEQRQELSKPGAPLEPSLSSLACASALRWRSHAIQFGSLQPESTPAITTRHWLGVRPSTRRKAVAR